MRTTSKISHYHKGIVAFLLAPFLWLQMYFHALEDWLIGMFHDELFNREESRKYSQVTHILAFACFSGFCLLAYYKHLDEYIALILYGLWLINYFSVKFKTGLYVDRPAWARLEHKEDGWEWCLVAKGQPQARENFKQRDVKRVLIAAATYGDETFRNQVMQVWHISIETHDGRQLVVAQEADIQKALNQALELATKLDSRVSILESYGTSAFAEMDIGEFSHDVIAWEKAYQGNTTEIYKNFSSTSFLRWLRLIFHEAGDFIFIAVLAGMMERYGTLLMMMFWDELGLTRPAMVHIEISLPSLLSFFAPEFDWVLQAVIAVTFMVLLHGIYVQSRRHQVLLNEHHVEYLVSGKTKSRLSFNEKLEIVVLKGFDKTSLILLNEQNRLLEITGLEEDEYDQLYTMLLNA